MKNYIAGGFALLLLCVCGVHAQQASQLRLGTPVSATLAADGALKYELNLPKGHFVAGRVDQDGADATVTVTDPADKRVLRADRVGRGGPEAFAFATETAGRYVIEVTPATAGKVGSVRVQLTRSEPVATTPEGKVDQAASQLYKDTPGAVVGVIKGGQLVFVKGYGAADLTYGMPFTADTPTNIGSSSKQFTGFALALLASRGKLSLDDDVRKHIPELKDFGKKITLRHLLTHTTGYREFVNTLLIDGRQILEGDYIAPDEALKVVNRQPTLQNEPGAEFNYNNSAFSLATMVIERVTGRPFAEFMREEVFLPLGMTKTWVRANPGQIIPGRSIGYVAGDFGFREVRDLHASAGAGGIYTTPGDVAKWLSNLKTGKLGGPEVIKELTTPFTLNDGKSANYGYGVFIDTNRGLKRWQHGGNDIAHSSTFVYYPDLDAGYVVFSNYQGVPGGIAGAVADIKFASKPADDFLHEIVCDRLHAEEVYLGKGFAFGKNRSGNIGLLRAMSRELGFFADEVPEVQLRGQRISSSRIRKLLEEGRVNLARRMLGRPYGVEGVIVRGNRRGHTIGFPTANLRPHNRVIPKFGVYATATLVDGTWRKSITNIGVRPTFGKDTDPSIETYIFDFDGEVYGDVLRVRFLHRIRDERKFNGIEELKAQIERDTRRALNYFRYPGVRNMLEIL